jgi:hypothetical protein
MSIVRNESNQQLEDNTARFLRDRSRNRLRDGKLEVSSLFDWYRENFERGWRGADGLAEFLALYDNARGLSEEQRQALLKGKLPVRFLNYDWSLTTSNDNKPTTRTTINQQGEPS